MSFQENSNKLCFPFDLCDSMNYDMPAFAQKETPEMFGFFRVVFPRYGYAFQHWCHRVRNQGIQSGTGENPYTWGGKLPKFLRDLESGDLRAFLIAGLLFFSRHCAS